jgi:hypothetical protein
MATEMDNYVQFKNGNKEVFDRVREIFQDPTPDSKHPNYSTITPNMVNKLYGKNLQYKEEVGDDWNEETHWVPQDWWDEYVGSRYIHSQIDYLDDESGEGAIILTTAHQVPQGFLNNLAKDLAKIKEDVYIYGTYECETYDPVGAFIYAGDYEDIEDNDSIEVCEIVEMMEDFDIEDVDIDGKEIMVYEDGFMWFNECPNGREKLHDNQAELRDSLEEAYFEYLTDKKNNPEDYE